MTIDGDDVSRRRVFSPLLATDFHPLSSSVKAEFGARTHAGRNRLQNEDHYLVLRLGRHQETLLSSLPAADLPGRFDEYGYVLMVADGLGAAGAGGVASRVALSAVAHILVHFGQWNLRVDKKVASDIISRLDHLYQGVSAMLTQRSASDERLADMATTLTAMYSVGTDLFVAHVGHSRAYLYRDGDLMQLTRDQTLDEHRREMSGPASVGSGMEDIRHILTETLGGRRDGPLVDIHQLRLVDGDQILLCTNGLTDQLPDEKIADVLALRRQPDEQCQHLVELALDAGGKDDVTAVMAAYSVPREATDGAR